MIFEMSIDNAKAGNAARAMELVHRVRVQQYGDRGALQGAWTSELGPVNRVVQMWAYDSLEAWSRVQAGFDADPKFQDDYVKPMQALVNDQERRVLRAHRPFSLHVEPGHFYELRMYDLIPGGGPRFVAPMLDIIPFREKYSINMGMWTPVTGNLNQLVHMWAYRDLAHRSAVRGALAKTPEWKAYLDIIFPLITNMQCTIMLPAAFSPVR